MISFAQNFEDVVLNRAFKHQETGFYVDIGCGGPVINNVTLSLYRNGWHGLVVDGDSSVLSDYSLDRPRDIVRHAWISSKQEKRTWVQSDVAGLSRLSAGAPEDPNDPNTMRVSTKTVSDLLTEEGRTSLDLLKIDCEGADFEVLRGSALRRFRPRVVVVEVLNPQAKPTSTVHLTWYMRFHGYKKCLFDGVNIFFCLRTEKEIAKAISYPACVLDMPFHRYQQALAMGWVDGDRSDDLPM